MDAVASQLSDANLTKDFDRRAITDDLIRHITDTIVARFQPRRIILFGSRARGDARPDSDLDLFVEMQTSDPPVERAVAIDSIFGLRSWPMDIVVYTPDEVERWQHVTWSLLYDIETEGLVLYERP